MPIQRVLNNRRVDIDEIQQTLQIAFRHPLNDFCFYVKHSTPNELKQSFRVVKQVSGTSLFYLTLSVF